MDIESIDLNALPDYYYYYAQPPYLILLGGLLSSLLAGIAFQTVLKELIQAWQADRSTRSLAELRGWRLLTPFLGMAGGALFFLAAGVEIFGVPTKFAYIISTIMSAGIGRLVWWQLCKVLEQLEKGGSAALDLDN
jgi:hypothetical protein